MTSFILLLFDCTLYPQTIGRGVVDKLTELSKIGFSVECFTGDFLRVIAKGVKVCGIQLGTDHQIQAI